MVGLIKFLAFLAIVFFAVGEFAGGWYLGVASQTPVMVYKKTTTKQVTRRAVMSNEFPFKIDGKLQSGTLTVEGIYERPTSFQTPSIKPLAPKTYFSETFEAGRPIHIDERLKKGSGVYTLRLTFTDATGKVTVDVPDSSAL